MKEEILKEFREKKELAHKKLQVLAVVNGSVVDAEIITEEWLSQTIDKALKARDEEWREKIENLRATTLISETRIYNQAIDDLIKLIQRPLGRNQ